MCSEMEDVVMLDNCQLYHKGLLKGTLSEEA